MPAVVQKDSEYHRNYQWNASRKSRSYSPPLEAMKPAAGVASEIAAKHLKPTITTKKKLQGSKSASGTKLDFDAVDDDYMILGNNEKFAENIRYRSKSRDRAMNMKKTQKPENGADVPTPDAPRNPPPAPKVAYDTGAPKPKVRQSAEAPKVSKSVEVQNGRHVPAVKPVKSALKAPPAEPKVKTQEVKPTKSKSEPVIREVKQVQQKPAKEVRPSKSQGKPVERREKRTGKLHEFVQTDMDQGVADSGQQVPADYALRYQKGVAPPRSKGPKRLSEYEMQYKWRKGLPSSPMLDAEQLVYKSNPQAPPFGSRPMNKASEYKSQFQAWQLMKSTPDLSQAARQEGKKGGSKPSKHKRSHSMEDLTPDQRPAAGTEAVIPPEDKRILKESLNPQRLHFPHGKSKRVRSEYSSNYAAPQKFDYSMGAWMGADPPHIVNRPETDSIISQEGESRSKAWFSEVVELRRRAEEYKKRAQGTHFSREHLAQLYARQAEAWDTVSTQGESVVSALSLETARSSVASSARAQKRGKVGGSLQLDVGSMGSVTPHSERTLTPEPVDDLDLEDVDDDLYTPSARSVDLTPGRVPTPKLATKTDSRRHHLDRTTPAVGGAILTSPDLPVCTKKPSVEAWVETPDQVVRESFSAPGHLNLTKSPAFGKPTEDSHVLVDEETASDRTLNLDYVKSKPQVSKAKKDLATRLSTIKEMSAEYKSTGKSTNPAPESMPAVTLGLRQSYPMPSKPLVQETPKKEQRSMSMCVEVGNSARKKREEVVRMSALENKTQEIQIDKQATVSNVHASDITELKCLANPPVAVKLVLEAVCILLGVKPVNTGPKGKQQWDYWPSSKKMMADSSFLKQLKEYDSTNTPDSVMAKIREDILSQPVFNVESVKKVSAAAVGLCQWVLAHEANHRQLKGKTLTTKASMQSKGSKASSSLDSQNLRDLIKRTQGEIEQLQPLIMRLEAVVSEHANVVEGLKGSMAYAMPAFEAARKSLNVLTKGDLVEVKAMCNPPVDVKRVMEAVCILTGRKPDLIADPNNPGGKIADYWSVAKKMLNDPTHLQSLAQLDIDAIPAAAMTKVRTEYCNDSSLQIDRVRSVSASAAGVLQWVHAVEAYDRIKQSIGPKMRNLHHAEQNLASRRKQLESHQTELKALQQKLRRLQQHYSKVTGQTLSQHSPPMKKAREQDAVPHLNGVEGECIQGELQRNGVGPLRLPLEEEDDAVSLSARSVASTCSLASDLYERAKQRRDLFW